MTLRIGSIVIGAADVQRAVQFWCAALAYRPRDEPESDWAVLVPADGEAPNLSIAKTDEVAPAEPRTHLDLYTARPVSEIARLRSLGAVLIDWPHYPDAPDFTVLADPEGNRFCVIDKSGGSR
ncbi:VOC family protein [Pseudonocardia kongjuensis]|uniref:VOC family protein n=1 Tax=Pseudonocardia kongjuensis TaxID=102227 RepID=A0ABP4IXR5_9PSEU